jgi:hypothetical protein
LAMIRSRDDADGGKGNARQHQDTNKHGSILKDGSVKRE